MRPLEIPEQALGQRPWAYRINFGPPKNYQQTRGLEDCGSLPVLFDKTPDHDNAICRSYWQPTADELERLNAGDPVQLAVVGTQVPVSISVGP